MSRYYQSLIMPYRASPRPVECASRPSSCRGCRSRTSGCNVSALMRHLGVLGFLAFDILDRNFFIFIVQIEQLCGGDGLCDDGWHHRRSGSHPAVLARALRGLVPHRHNPHQPDRQRW